MRSFFGLALSHLCRLLTRSSAPLQAETFLKKLEPVVARLNESHPTAALDRKAVASVIYQMRLFEDEVLSKKVLLLCHHSLFIQLLVRDCP